MSKVLEGLFYAKSHEWVKIEGDEALIGITDYAQHSLGNIVYLEASEVGASVKQNEQYGTIESVKAASDLNAPLSGEVIAVNEEVVDNPELINDDPYGCWIIRIKVKDLHEKVNLLNAEQYRSESK